MEINVTTPAVLFPAVSLLLLAYTNRFIAVDSTIRQLHAAHQATPNPALPGQLANLRRRIRLIRNMQFFGVLSLLLCTICMYLLFFGYVMPGEQVFSAGLVAMMISLLLSLIEVQTSVTALDVHLQDIEKPDTTG